jgi:hypothetical protein
MWGKALRIDQAPSKVGTQRHIDHTDDDQQGGTQCVQVVVLSNVRQSQRQQIERDQQPKQWILGLKKSREFHRQKQAMGTPSLALKFKTGVSLGADACH